MRVRHSCSDELLQPSGVLFSLITLGTPLRSGFTSPFTFSVLYNLKSFICDFSGSPSNIFIFTLPSTHLSLGNESYVVVLTPSKAAKGNASCSNTQSFPSQLPTQGQLVPDHVHPAQEQLVHVSEVVLLLQSPLLLQYPAVYEQPQLAQPSVTRFAHVFGVPVQPANENVLKESSINKGDAI